MGFGGTLIRCLYVALLWIIGSQTAIAQSRLDAAYLPDDNFTISTIALAPTERWQPLLDANLSLGFNTRPHWLRITLPATKGPVFLLLAYPHLDHVRFYQLHEGQPVRQITTGDMLPFAMRPLAHRDFVFPVSASSSTQTLYLWVQTNGVLQVPLQLLSREELAQSDHRYLLMQGLFYGFFLAAGIFALFLWLTHCDSTYGLFGLLVLAYAAVEGLYSGLLFAYAWPQLPAFNQMAMPIFLAFAVALAARFALRVFRLMPGERGYYICQALLWAALGFMALSPLLPFAVALKASLILVGVHCFTQAMLGAAWVRARRAGSGWYCAAWAIFLAGTLGAVLNCWGLVLVEGTATYSISQLASLLQIILLTFMVCSRVKLDFSRQLEQEFNVRSEQRKAIEHEHAQAQMLAQAVEEKTAALQAALCEVSKLNMELSKQTITDSLTGLFNRRHFDHLLETEVRRAAREHRPISLVLIDVDHFKKINDT
ncbi:MAG: diguanylate cyclase, partial [Sphingobacteriales bacterium]